MPNGEQGEKERTGETDGAANRRGHAEREGKRGRGENLQNSKEYFRNRITATSSIDYGKVGPSWHLATRAFSLQRSQHPKHGALQEFRFWPCRFQCVNIESAQAK